MLSRTPLNHQYPVKSQQSNTIINICIGEHNSGGDGGGYGVDSLSTVSTFLMATNL